MSDAFLISAGAAFFGGALSFLSPCVLPLVPAYLCFAAGLKLDEAKAGQPILPSALAFVAGFSTVFIALGAAAGAVNPLLLAHKDILARLAGGIIILLGLHISGLIRLRFLLREWRVQTPAPQKQGGQAVLAFTMGLGFAFGWTPCIGPILATILTLAAARESLGEGVLLLAFYAAGLGLPFIFAAMGVERFLAASAYIKRHLAAVEYAAGGLLIITGVMIFTGDLQALGAHLLDMFPILARLG